MATETNQALRQEIARQRIKQWEIAQELGITASYLCVLFRAELSPSMKAKCFRAIETIKAKI